MQLCNVGTDALALILNKVFTGSPGILVKQSVSQGRAFGLMCQIVEEGVEERARRSVQTSQAPH